MKIYLPSLLLLSLSIFSSATAETTAEDYAKLKSHYQSVLDQVEAAKAKDLEAVKSRQADKATKLSAGHKENGNIGFFLSSKNYAEFLKEDQLDRMNWNKVQDDQLKNLHQETLREFDNVESAYRKQQFHMMDRMKALLQERIAEANGNPELSAKMKQDLEEITSDPLYQNTGNKITQQQAQRSAMLAKQAAQKPKVTPTPFPVNTQPRLDIDVFRKRTGKSPPEFHPTLVKVQLRSKEMRRVYENVMIEVWFVDRMADSSKEFRIESKHKLKVGELGLGQLVEKETPVINANPQKPGKISWDFYGYVVAVKDKDGELLTYKSFPNRLDEIERAEKVMENDDGDTFRLF